MRLAGILVERLGYWKRRTSWNQSRTCGLDRRWPHALKELPFDTDWAPR